jgi:hypothetical protein
VLGAIAENEKTIKHFAETCLFSTELKLIYDKQQ